MKKKAQPRMDGIWSEVKSDHTDEETGVSAIDAYYTENSDEGGNVIATVDLDGVITYKAQPAKTDVMAQKVIKEVVKEKLTNKQKLVDQVVKLIIFECDGTEFEDSTMIELLLMDCPSESLTAFLPD